MLFYIISTIFILFLQVYLSKSKNKWLGLILPILSFLFSLVIPLNMVSTGDMPKFIIQMASAWLMANIPTAILAIIYIISREKFRKIKEIDKMNIKDLE